MDIIMGKISVIDLVLVCRYEDQIALSHCRQKVYVYYFKYTTYLLH
jgi:hypothetical protein